MVQGGNGTRPCVEGRGARRGSGGRSDGGCRSGSVEDAISTSSTSLCGRWKCGLLHAIVDP